MSIEAPPTAPARSMIASAFNDAVEAYLAWLEGDFIPGVNALASAGAFDAGLWVSGTTYAIGDLTWSPIDYAVYRRITNGAGTTDPSADATNWAPVVSVPTTTAPLQLENVGLAVTMAANAVTIALKGADGNDPSASNAVGIGFRSATITSGAASKVSTTSAKSTVISSGSTGGTVSATASRIWIGAILVAGAIELAWFNARSGTNIAPINEGGLISTTAEGGAGAADTAQTWYSTTARSNVPVTILGYFDSTQATAGTWASAAGAVVVNPRYRPGDVVQRKIDSTAATPTITSNIPQDDTIPQNGSEGTTVNSVAITPTAAANVLEMYADGWCGCAESVFGYFAQDAVANALRAFGGYRSGSSGGSKYAAAHEMIAGTTSSTTLKWNMGSNTGNIYPNSSAGSRYFGGASVSYMAVKEIMA